MLGIPAIAVSQQSSAARWAYVSGRFDFSRRRAPSPPSWSRDCSTEPLPEGDADQRQLPGRRADGRRGDPPRQAPLQRRAEAGRRGRRTAAAATEIYGFEPCYEDERGHRPRPRSPAGRISVTPDPLRPHRPRRPRAPARLGPRGDAGGLRSRPREPRGRREAGARSCARELERHNHRYYVLDDPEIGDDAYDALLDELREIEAEQPRAAHPRLADPAGRRPAARPLRAGRARRADALARQRPQRGGAARLGDADPQPAQAARHQPRRVQLHDRAEDRRPRDLAHLRGRRPGPRRHPRRRPDRRGRHPQPAHDRLDPAADRRRAGADRGPRRGLPPRSPPSKRSTSAAPRPASRRSPTPATPPPARSASSTRRSPPSGRSRSGATGSAPPAGSTSPPTPTSSSGCASAASRSTPTPTTTRRRVGRRALPLVGGAPRGARLRDRRRRRQGRRAGALARARRRRPRAALGDRLEVPADDGDDEAEARSSGTSGAPVTWSRSRCSSRSTSAASPSPPRPSTTRRTWRARTCARATRWS